MLRTFFKKSAFGSATPLAGFSTEPIHDLAS